LLADGSSVIAGRADAGMTNGLRSVASGDADCRHGARSPHLRLAALRGSARGDACISDAIATKSASVIEGNDA
jgi:hypothetical protein